MIFNPAYYLALTVFVEEYDIISDVNFCKKYERENERLWNY